MTRHSRSIWILLSALLSVLLVASAAFALEPGKDGYYVTGSAIRTKTFLKVKVYSIHHDMKQLPPAKSKQAVIDADVDKRFVWTMMRDVGAEKIQESMRDSFAMNGYTDMAKINAFLAAFKGEAKEGSTITFAYNAATKTTTLTTGTGGASVAGVDFMKATWSIWFGKIDPPSIGDALISNL